MLELLLEGIRALRDGRLEATPQARDAGRQYFVLHPRLYERARARLAAVASPGA
jgi:acyl-coenzyme A thioesterase PaaI-like protein